MTTAAAPTMRELVAAVRDGAELTPAMSEALDHLRTRVAPALAKVEQGTPTIAEKLGPFRNMDLGWQPGDGAIADAIVAEVRAHELWRRAIPSDEPVGASIPRFRASELARRRRDAAARPLDLSGVLPRLDREHRRFDRALRDAHHGHRQATARRPRPSPPPRRVTDVRACLAAPHGPTLAAVAAAA